MAEKKTVRKPKAARTSATAAPASPEQAAEKQRQAGALASSGLFNAAAVMVPLQSNLVGGDATADAIYNGLQDKLTVVQAGDMTPIESMLLSQAASLQTIYSSLARKAASQEYLTQYQTFLTLALKAQAQSRATLEALIELKHPRHPPTFVKQANIAHGPQQVNHTYATMQGHTAKEGFCGKYAQAHARTEDLQSAPNKLLEEPHETQDHPDPGRNPDPVAIGRTGSG